METKQSNNSATPMADAVKIANQRALFSLEWENDTVFKKRELNYKTKAAFQKDLEAGKISKYTTVFIKDSKEIYKNGQYYGTSSSQTSNKGVLAFDFSSLSEESGTISDEILNSIKEVGLKDSKSASIQFMRQGITYVGELRYSAGDYSILGASVSESIMNYVIGYITITISSDLKTYVLSSSSQEIQNSGLGDKFLSNDGTYKEVSDTIINIDNLDNYTGTLLGITYNEIVDCIKRNGSIKVRVNINGMNSIIFTPMSCMYIEESNVVMISIDISSTSSDIYTQTSVFLISSDNSYVVSSINKTILGDTSTNDGDIHIIVSYYDGVKGQQSVSSSITLEKTGDGTQVLTNNGTYKSFVSEAPTDGSVYGRKDKQWEKLIKQKVVTESEYSALGSAVNTDGILYFVTPD